MSIPTGHESGRFDPEMAFFSIGDKWSLTPVNRGCGAALYTRLPFAYFPKVESAIFA